MNGLRNFNLEILKIILAFFVVAGHTLTTGEIEGSKNLFFYVVHGIARLAVPLFYIISGYYLGNRIYSFNKIKNKLISYLRLFLVWQSIYLIIEIYFYFQNAISLKKLIVDLFFGMGHLWYLIAFIHALFFCFLLNRIDDHLKFFLAICIFITGYILQYLNTFDYINSNKFHEIYTTIGGSRNGFFYTLPYLIVGTQISFFECKIQNINKLLVISLILLVFEVLFYYNSEKLMVDVFLTALPVSLLIFIKTQNFKFNSRILKFPSTFSTGIYLLHYLPIFICYNFFIPQSTFSYLVLFTIVAISSMFIWFLLDKINKKVKILF
ncbi:acyltransferase family protein [Flavobacterium columnare]|uniref:acyltransferase family protein n=1 Tax=Flavobacterium columnare TaxID=996 RepID=UPI0040337D8B